MGQLREEFLNYVYLNAFVIVARVYCFGFRHSVTFFKRLSAKELRSLATSNRLRDSRKLIVELELGPIPKALKRDHGLVVPQIGLGDLFLLRTWLKRLAHPTKKGKKVEISYLVSDIPGSPGYSDLRFWKRNLGVMGGEMPPGSHQQAEVMKIAAAVGENAQRSRVKAVRDTILCRIARENLLVKPAVVQHLVSRCQFEYAS